jgi:myo-inositol-hexaphosphate 3-phosphohydrolase
VKDQHTVYGLALWSDKAAGKLYAVGTQRTEPRLGVFSLTPTAAGNVRVEMTRDVRVPAQYRGQDLRTENDDDPLKDWNPQFEGVVVDQRTGLLYAGEEDVGIWRVDLKTGTADKAPFYETRGAKGSPFANPASVVARDVEGLTIYYGPGNTAYLIASSQGGAHGEDGVADAPFDDSFVVFDLSGPAKLLGSFRVGANPDRKIDAVQESDGAAVISMALPGWPNGLFITQDGYNDDLDGLSGEPSATNFKYVDWKAVADAFEPKLVIAPGAWNPR